MTVEPMSLAEREAERLTREAERRPYLLGVAGMFVVVVLTGVVGWRASDLPAAAVLALAATVAAASWFGIHLIHTFGVHCGIRLQRDVQELFERENDDGPAS